MTIKPFLTRLFLVFFVSGCASTTIIESPKTAFVPEGTGAKDPAIVWSSRQIGKNYDYLGEIKVKSWTYGGALGRLKDAGRQLRADAVVDVQYQQVGFLTTFSAFAVKYK